MEVFDLASGEAQKIYPVIASSISRDGRWMASSDNAGNNQPVLWNLSDGKRVHDLDIQNAGRVIFRPDGQEVAITHSNSNTIDFVSTATGAVKKSLPGAGYGLGTAAYSADGKLLAAGSYSFATIKVWDLAGMKELFTLYGQSPVQTVTFSPDGKLLAAISGELRIWNVANGADVVTLTDAPVSRAAFSADGKWLAANPGGQFPGYAVKIWNTSMAMSCRGRSSPARNRTSYGASVRRWPSALMGNGSRSPQDGPMALSTSGTRHQDKSCRAFPRTGWL